jgi:hypothetical protein
MADEGLLTADNPPVTGETTDIFASVPKELRFSKEGNDKLARFTDPASLAKSFLEIEKMESGRVKIPTETSTEEERSNFYKKIGRPDSVEGYNLPQLPEGQAYDENLINTMRGIAFDSGVSDSQFNGLVSKFVEAQTAAQEARLVAENAEADATIKDLQTEWGQDYEKNLEVSKRALRELVPEDMKDDLVNIITEKNLDNNKLFIKFLQNVGEKMLDDSFVRGERSQPEDDDYTPKYPNSPEQYRNDDTEEGVKARSWFTKHKGFEY